MKICWDNLEKIKFTKNGKFRQDLNNNIYYYFIKSNCKFCGDDFFTRTNIDGLFCDNSCLGKWKEKEFGNISQFITEETRKKMSASHKGMTLNKNTLKKLRGKNHWNWKGGVTPIRNKIQNSEKYKQWREFIFERDSYQCQQCYQKGGNLNAHHIKRFADYPELRFDINNGITLCEKCHNKTKLKEEKYEWDFTLMNEINETIREYQGVI